MFSKGWGGVVCLPLLSCLRNIDAPKLHCTQYTPLRPIPLGAKVVAFPFFTSIEQPKHSSECRV